MIFGLALAGAYSRKIGMGENWIQGTVVGGGGPGGGGNSGPSITFDQYGEVTPSDLRLATHLFEMNKKMETIIDLLRLLAQKEGVSTEPSLPLPR
jgi:hypothetical protein